MFIIAIIIISVAILFGGIHKIGEGHVVNNHSTFIFTKREFTIDAVFYKTHLWVQAIIFVFQF